jgi:hypothetical protein
VQTEGRRIAESGDVRTWRWEGRGFNSRELRLLMYRAQFQKVGSEVPARTEVVPSMGRREREREQDMGLSKLILSMTRYVA